LSLWTAGKNRGSAAASIRAITCFSNSFIAKRRSVLLYRARSTSGETARRLPFVRCSTKAPLTNLSLISIAGLLLFGLFPLIGSIYSLFFPVFYQPPQQVRGGKNADITSPIADGFLLGRLIYFIKEHGK
jgi:hypothetical protein